MAFTGSVGDAHICIPMSMSQGNRAGILGRQYVKRGCNDRDI